MPRWRRHFRVWRALAVVPNRYSTIYRRCRQQLRQRGTCAVCAHHRMRCGALDPRSARCLCVSRSQPQAVRRTEEGQIRLCKLAPRRPHTPAQREYFDFKLLVLVFKLLICERKVQDDLRSGQSSLSLIVSLASHKCVGVPFLPFLLCPLASLPVRSLRFAAPYPACAVRSSPAVQSFQFRVFSNNSPILM